MSRRPRLFGNDLVGDRLIQHGLGDNVGGDGHELCVRLAPAKAELSLVERHLRLGIGLTGVRSRFVARLGLDSLGNVVLDGGRNRKVGRRLACRRLPTEVDGTGFELVARAVLDMGARKRRDGSW